MRQKIQVVWFKRDLRWFDNKPVYDSIQGNLPTLYFALYEPSLFALQQYDERHLRFIADSIEVLISKLAMAPFISSVLKL